MATRNRSIQRLFVLGVFAFGSMHCSGRLEPIDTGGGGGVSSPGAPIPGGPMSGGSSGGSAAASGGGPGSTCAQGAACSPGSGCATAPTSNGPACALSCDCDSTGHFQCNEKCPDASTPTEPTGCSDGASCTQNSGCGMGSPGGCTTSCTCDPTNHLKCTTTCPASDAGCVDNVLCIKGDHWDSQQCKCVPDQCVETVLCIAGDHWDSTLCKCVPNGCVSQAGGPCGGFVANPCTCAAGLVCSPSGMPDVAGTCQDGCKTAADCSGPLPQLCKMCGDGASGCAHWACVAGSCETAFCD